MKTALAWVIRIFGYILVALFWAAMVTTFGLCGYAIYLALEPIGAVWDALFEAARFISLTVALLIVLVAVSWAIAAAWQWSENHLKSRRE